jgi:hypothetical protein
LLSSLLAKKENPLNAMMSNPGGMTGSMMDGLKRNLPNVLTQPLVMVWVGFFFSGFVVGMPLTYACKAYSMPINLRVSQ